MKAAIYMCGHGPYREPRLIEVQYLRILRYCEALEKKLDTTIDIEDTYIDLNFSRTYYGDKLKNLMRLIEDIKDSKEVGNQNYMIGRFKIQDRWTSDLKQKVLVRVDDLIKSRS